jgi:Domain of unknown function (DUF4158)
MSDGSTASCEDVVERLEAPERLPEDIDADALRKYFTLSETDLEQVAQCRGAINKLGFALQLCTLRWRGHFLRDTRDISESVLTALASQLGVLPIPIDSYPQNQNTRFEHFERVRRYLKFVRCDAGQRARLLDHLTGVAQTLPCAGALRQEACRWLQQERIVRPGRTTLRDVISSAREGALQWVYGTLSNVLVQETRTLSEPRCGDEPQQPGHLLQRPRSARGRVARGGAG